MIEMDDHFSINIKNFTAIMRLNGYCFILYD